MIVKKKKKKSTFQDEDSGMAICGLGGSEDVSGMEMELVGGPEGSAFPSLWRSLSDCSTTLVQRDPQRWYNVIHNVDTTQASVNAPSETLP